MHKLFGGAMKRHMKVLGGAILLTGALLALAAPAAAQIRRPDSKENQIDGRGRTDADGKKVMPSAPVANAVTEIFFCESPTTECRSSNSTFTVGKLRDLYVFVTWPNVSGDLVQTVEFFLPDGSLYVKKVTPFRVSSGQPRARAVPGAAPTVDTFLTSSRGTPTVITPLAVAGTYVTQRSLLGTWTVRVRLGDKPVQSAQFTLKAPQQQ
jgi:hypothetical protein